MVHVTDTNMAPGGAVPKTRRTKTNRKPQVVSGPLLNVNGQDIRVEKVDGWRAIDENGNPKVYNTKDEAKVPITKYYLRSVLTVPLDKFNEQELDEVVAALLKNQTEISRILHWHANNGKTSHP